MSVISKRIHKLDSSINKDSTFLSDNVGNYKDLKYYQKNRIKKNLLNKIERFVLKAIEYDSQYGFERIRTKKDLLAKLSDMPKEIPLNKYELSVVGSDYIKEISTDWERVRNYIPKQLLDKLEPLPETNNCNGNN